MHNQSPGVNGPVGGPVSSLTPYADQVVTWASATAWRCFAVDHPLGKVEALRSGVLIVGKDDKERAALYYWCVWNVGGRS